MTPRRRLQLTATTVVAAGILTAGAPAANAQSVRMQPLGKRVGVVLDYRERSHTAIVVVSSGKMKAIHSLRRYRSGTRVRIRGIKWGRPIRGIKWGFRPRGIKWGIKWALNGTYSSPLVRIGAVGGVRVRGIVIARNRTAIAIATKGGVVTIVVPTAIPAVTGSITRLRAGGTGSIVTIPVTMTSGLLTAGTIRTVGSSSVVPVAGSISAISVARRTITIDATSDAVLPIRITMAVPSTLDLSGFAVGDEVAAVARRGPGGALLLGSLSRNESFAAANDPSKRAVAPRPASAATIDLLNGLVNQVDVAVRSAKIGDAAVATAAATQIREARSLAWDGDFAGAIASLDQFSTTIADGRTAAVVETATATRLIKLADGLATRLKDPKRR